jgi:hypothetical protein
MILHFWHHPFPPASTMCAFCIPLAPFTLLAPSFEGSLEGSFEGCATPGRPRRAFPNKSPLAVRLLPPWCPASAVGACGYSSFPHESRVTNHESQSLPSLSFQPITNCPVCKSFVLITINTYEPLATVDSKRLTQTLSPLDATLTKTGGRGLRLYRARRREGS